MDNQSTPNPVKETVPNVSLAIGPTSSPSPPNLPIPTKYKSLRYPVLVVFIMLLILSGILFLSKRRIQNNKVALSALSPTASISTLPTNPITFNKVETKTAVESPKWKAFSSTKLKFSFLYPEEWGVASEEIVDHGPGPITVDKVVIGKAYILNFSNSEFIYGGGRSKDFSAPRDTGLGDYQGDPKKPKGVTSRISAGWLCSLNLPETPSNALIELNLPDQEISGVRLVLPGLSDSDTTKFYSLATNNQECNDENQGKIDSNAQKVLDSFIASKSYDQTTAINLSIFDEIAKSATVY